MSTIRNAIKQIVDHYTMDPAWIQGEVNRLTGNRPDIYDVIFKGKLQLWRSI